jgi:hypothetical protein
MPTLARRACWLGRGVRKSRKVQTIRIVNVRRNMVKKYGQEIWSRNMVKKYDLRETSGPNCLLKVKPLLS